MAPFAPRPRSLPLEVAQAEEVRHNQFINKYMQGRALRKLAAQFIRRTKTSVAARWIRVKVEKARDSSFLLFSDLDRSPADLPYRRQVVWIFLWDINNDLERILDNSSFVLAVEMQDALEAAFAGLGNKLQIWIPDRDFRELFRSQWRSAVARYVCCSHEP